ncbi:MAG TPA: hypothetical protein VFL69_10170 [Marmoricola sp.]|nr:hypothetical protein [Marmoricola sp.]
MNALIMIILAIAFTVGLVRLTIALFDVITGDGYGARPGPRSHHDDTQTYDRAA